jgi:thymidine kinase
MLAAKIRSNNNIKGLETRGLKTKVSLYTDDSCFLLNPQLESLHDLIEDLDTFAILSGLKTNYDKCTILRIGSLKNANLT